LLSYGNFFYGHRPQLVSARGAISSNPLVRLSAVNISLDYSW
jgi:hypothetical protein